MVPKVSSLEKGKRVIVSATSSSSSQEEEELEDEEEEEEELDSDGDDDDDEDPDFVSEDDGDLEEEEYSSDDGGGGDASENRAADEELCQKVIDLFKRRESVDVLKLEECKAYLRKHNLRLSGTKAACVERIQEHWRIKDGNGESLYPRSSFVVNCTGDVCAGDVILFKQRVYEKFDKVTRGANIIGKRIIAGRVVKESYGAAKQQHTFTVEVLWCKGVKALPPLFPLLVKGRNLYRLKTFRQRWNDEAERSNVLAEKHRRGAAARYIRAMAKARSASKGSKRQRSSCNKNAPANKRRKKELLPSVTKQQEDHRTKSAADGHKKAKQGRNTRRHGSFPRHLKEAHHNGNKIHQQCNFSLPSSYDQYHNHMVSHRLNNLPSSQANRGMHVYPQYNARPGYSSVPNDMFHPHTSYRNNHSGYPSPGFKLDPRSTGHGLRQVEYDRQCNFSLPSSYDQYHNHMVSHRLNNLPSSQANRGMHVYPQYNARPGYPSVPNDMFHPHTSYRNNRSGYPYAGFKH